MVQHAILYSLDYITRDVRPLHRHEKYLKIKKEEYLMKISKTFLLFITVILVASVGIVVAEDATVEPYTFTIPDGYTIATSDDTTCAMQKDEYNAISFATGVSVILI